MTVFTTLVLKTIETHEFSDPVFTSVKICDGSGNDITIAVDASDASIAFDLADAIRAAALRHMPAKEEVPA